MTLNNRVINTCGTYPAPDFDFFGGGSSEIFEDFFRFDPIPNNEKIIMKISLQYFKIYNFKIGKLVLHTEVLFHLTLIRVLKHVLPFFLFHLIPCNIPAGISYNFSSSFPSFSDPSAASFSMSFDNFNLFK